MDTWTKGIGKDIDLRASLVAQTVRNPPAMQETRVQCLGWEDPLEKGMATHSCILAWRIPWTEEPGRLQSRRSQRAGHDWETKQSKLDLRLGTKPPSEPECRSLRIQTTAWLTLMPQELWADTLQNWDPTWGWKGLLTRQYWSLWCTVIHMLIRQKKPDWIQLLLLKTTATGTDMWGGRSWGVGRCSSHFIIKEWNGRCMPHFHSYSLGMTGNNKIQKKYD